jgi:hypothetical protein
MAVAAAQVLVTGVDAGGIARSLSGWRVSTRLGYGGPTAVCRWRAAVCSRARPHGVGVRGVRCAAPPTVTSVRCVSTPESGGVLNSRNNKEEGALFDANGRRRSQQAPPQWWGGRRVPSAAMNAMGCRSFRARSLAASSQLVAVAHTRPGARSGLSKPDCGDVSAGRVLRRAGCAAAGA